MQWRRVGLGAVAVALTVTIGAPAAQAATCSNAGKVTVPGAERQEQACLEDMTTAGTTQTGHTDASDFAGLTPTAQKNPSGVPGLQVDGYFPDTSTTNGTHGWNHDSQFVIRLPDRWNGKLVITGAPGVRKQYAPDPVISDWVLSKGYAYASTDKGNSGNSFYADGAQPGDAIAEWHRRVTELTVATKQVVAQKYGRTPDRTYVTGISNGGYLTRWQLENRPDLYDGGVDWEGTLMSAAGPNLFTYLPVALRNYPRYRSTGDRAAHDAMIAAGFAPGSEFLWDDHYGVYWDLTQRVYREELDPDYDGPIAGGIPFCQPGTPNCDADYDYDARGEPVRAAIRKAENTGRIGKPMLTLHGTLDALLPIGTDSDPYKRMITAAGRGGMHRYYVVENGNHVDGRYDVFPDRIRPIWPCWATALGALEAWVERGTAPPPDQFLPDERKPGVDVANSCAIPRGAAVAGAGPFTNRSQVRRKTPRAVVVRVRPRRDRRRPYRFRVTGRLVLPVGMKATQVCGSGRFVVYVGSVRRTPRLSGGCTFRIRARFGERPTRGRLTVRVRWMGNRALRPRSAARRTVRAGRR